MLASSLIWIVALLHVYFLYLEMFLWTKPKGRKTFRMTQEHANATAALAANQGLYNGFLAAGLIWSTVTADPDFARSLGYFFLSCVLVAAVYGAYSVNRRILMIQGLPAACALLALFLS
jgi:putative membrane protein